MAQQPRKINTNRAHGAQQPAQRSAQRPAPKTAARRTRTAQAAHAQPGSGASRQPARRSRYGKKKKSRIKWWMPLLVVLALVVGAGAYAASYVNRIVDSIEPDNTHAVIDEEVKTAPEYQGDIVGILVCGIDYEEGRAYGDTESNDGMTDMIMYVQFDVKNRKLNMLQIPRNTLVGKTITLENGKKYKARNGQINSIALSNEEGIAALAAVVHNNYQLPVDYYVTIDMDALVEVVDLFGGIEVYVPQDIAYGGSKLTQGYHNLDGASAEFFVRNRKGAGYETSDLARLNMQRYFYAGLFKRVATLVPKDIVKLMPVIMNNYITTDCDVMTIISLAVSFLKVDSANMMVCQTPVFMDCDYYENNSIVVADAAAIGDLLNKYFRDYTGEVPVSQLNLMDWSRRGGGSSDPNIQFMGQLHEQGNQAILEGNTDVEGAQVTG